MICPHCKKDIADTTVAKHLAGKGGRKSKRTITPEQQAKMQEKRRSPEQRELTSKRMREYYEKNHPKEGGEDEQA